MTPQFVRVTDEIHQVGGSSLSLPEICSGDQPIARWSSTCSFSGLRHSIRERRQQRDNAMRSAEADL